MMITVGKEQNSSICLRFTNGRELSLAYHSGSPDCLFLLNHTYLPFCIKSLHSFMKILFYKYMIVKVRHTLILESIWTLMAHALNNKPISNKQHSVCTSGAFKETFVIM